MISLSGCGMYPAKPGEWPGGVWGSILQWVSSVIDYTASHLAGGSYGLALLMVTVAVRLILLPLMVKQIRYQKVMQAMQPEIQKIQQKYKGDNQKIQQETMKLWQEHGVNPMSGCLPMLLQLPILYALYGAIEGNVHMSKSVFLGIFLLGKPDHFYILPVAAALTTYLSSRLAMGAVEGQQRMMLYIMPVFIFIIGARFPSGLALYWVYSNLFQAVQTYFVKVRPEGAGAAAVAAGTAGPGGASKGSAKRAAKGVGLSSPAKGSSDAVTDSEPSKPAKKKKGKNAKPDQPS
ncbi:MAG: YidC/Oxa1 family membrane protein insertase [Alicyclobacillus sp.]|nr:YidC/Oxa1 family membrane protein insertase [Alicyclobacillus sp.]